MKLLLVWLTIFFCSCAGTREIQAHMMQAKLTNITHVTAYNTDHFLLAWQTLDGVTIYSQSKEDPHLPLNAWHIVLIK